MIILGIESTCDETGAAVVEDPSTHSTSSVQASSGQVGEKQLKILSNVVASSVDLHEKYGGVVPEVAAREQVKVIIPVIREALEQAFGSIRDVKRPSRVRLDGLNNSRKFAYPIDAIAVAYGPGLIGSLLIGVETAKALALVWDKPLIAVNHLVGHIYANWLEPVAVNSKWKMVNGRRGNSIHHSQSTINFPVVALIVSGGHTDLVLMTAHSKFKLLGSTLDDAAGEAFDKVAKLLGLGYPGGPEIEKLAAEYKDQETNFKLPRPMIGSKDFDFSFSGLKTAVVNLAATYHLQGVDSRHSGLTRTDSGVVPQSETPQNDNEGGNDLKAHVAYEFQQAVVDVLVKKTIRAAVEYRARTILVGGGVAANELLRKELRVKSLELKIRVLFPQKNLAVDNGAMIAAAAFFNFKKINPLELSADPSLHF